MGKPSDAGTSKSPLPPAAQGGQPAGSSVQCLRCKGTGRLTKNCDLCSGRGETVVSCRKCSGKGTYSQKAGPCARCEATGLQRDGSQCPRCKGHKVQLAFSTPCSRCSGNGALKVACKKCGGSLHVDSDCDACKGTGWYSGKN